MDGMTLAERLERIETLILENREPEKRMNVEEAAAYLGVETTTLYQTYRARGVPHHKALGKLHFFKSELEQYLKSH